VSSICVKQCKTPTPFEVYFSAKSCKSFLIEAVLQLRAFQKGCLERNIEYLEALDPKKRFKFLNVKQLLESFPPVESNETSIRI